jgi:hypothetical protein
MRDIGYPSVFIKYCPQTREILDVAPAQALGFKGLASHIDLNLFNSNRVSDPRTE